MLSCCFRLPTLLHVIGCCCAKFETGQTFHPTTPNISFVPWSLKGIATILDPARLHRSFNVVGATYAHYAWFTKTYGLYPSHDALQVPTLLGVVAFFLHTTANTHSITPNKCWELLHPFARSLNGSVTYPLSITRLSNSRFQSSCRAQHINRTLALICFYYIDR